MLNFNFSSYVSSYTLKEWNNNSLKTMLWGKNMKSLKLVKIQFISFDWRCFCCFILLRLTRKNSKFVSSIFPPLHFCAEQGVLQAAEQQTAL